MITLIVDDIVTNFLVFTTERGVENKLIKVLKQEIISVNYNATIALANWFDVFKQRRAILENIQMKLNN